MCTESGNSIISFNAAEHCGYSDWHLPTMTTPVAGTYVESSGGNWGALGIYATQNGWSVGNDLSLWLNANNFNVMDNDELIYWSSLSFTSSLAWGVNISYKALVGTGASTNSGGVLVVRGGGQ